MDSSAADRVRDVAVGHGSSSGFALACWRIGHGVVDGNAVRVWRGRSGKERVAGMAVVVADHSCSA